MADPTQTNSLLILLGNGATPTEVFAHPCGANVNSLTLTNNTGEDTVLDCTDPLGEAAAITRWVESQDTALSISGRIAKESWAIWQAWAEGTVKNVKIEMGNSVGFGGGTYTVPAILQSFELTRTGKQTVTFNATIVGAGRRAYAAAS